MKTQQYAHRHSQSCRVVVTLFGIVALTGCNNDEGPCLESGDSCIAGESGETGFIEVPECAPFDKESDIQEGVEFACQGAGSGYLNTTVVGLGARTDCLAYADGIPANPTPEDCALLPFSQIPFGIPEPAACCESTADTADIIYTCNLDCGFAACKTAVEQIRASADALQAPTPVFNKAFDRAKQDLYAYADVLEQPASLRYCATEVERVAGQLTEINLGSGVSTSGLNGHISDATLFVGCFLDPVEPFVPVDGAPVCDAATNIVEAETGEDGSGIINQGAVTVFDITEQLVVPLTDATFSFRESTPGDPNPQFTLVSLDMTFPDTTVGSFDLAGIQASLVAPVEARVAGELLTFPAGVLRFAVTASVAINGEPLFDGTPQTSTYVNTQPATGVRTVDGSFYLLDAEFRAGEFTVVLNTEPALMVMNQ